MTEAKKPEIAVPEEAVGRGPILMGELRSEDHRFPSILAQFQKIDPSSRKARLYIFTTAEQARKLKNEHGPFSFEGSFMTCEGVTEYRSASDIWLKPITQITNKEALYWAQTSGQIGVLKTREVYDNGPYQDQRTDLPFAWFVADRCFLLQVIANQERDEKEEARKFGFSREDTFLKLNDGATAEVRRYLRSYRPNIMRDTKKMGYSIHVRNYKEASQAKTDVDVLLLLASFVSRERAVSTHWRENTVKEESVGNWHFNWERYPKRDDQEEPLLLRNPDNCRDFIQSAFDIYYQSQHRTFLDTAIYALLARDLTLEVRFARLFFGVEGALAFALQKPKKASRPRVGVLFQEFLKRYDLSCRDLWPLSDSQIGMSLSQIRNSIIHGEAIPEKDFMALSFATENLQWYLERIVLVALGWDVERSAVSPGFLNRYFAYHWQKEQQNFKF